MKKPEITDSEAELLLDRGFLKLYDLHYKGIDYYAASRHEKEDLVALKKEEDFRKSRPDAVTCVVIVKTPGEEERLLLAREFRYPLGQFVLSPPAGLIDPEDEGEKDALLTAASREIFEETGIRVKDTDRIFVVNPGLFSSAGLTDESNAFVCACVELPDLTCLSQAGGVGSELFDGFRLLTRQKARELITKGRDDADFCYPLQTWAAALYFLSGLWQES